MDHQGRASARIALIDGNSFYCACERVMQPALAGKPLIVLSNNDGCAIARSNEAKALGIRMGAPWFSIRHLESRGLVARSANFALYGDMSDRMMTLIGQFAPHQEIYSIDESFLDLDGLPGTGQDIGQAIRHRIAQWLGLPTCVGIGASKTLAKLANHLAKTYPVLQGVCDLCDIAPERRDRALALTPVDAVWGIGRRLAPRLRAQDIHTALDLARSNPRDLRSAFSSTVADTARELAGEACLGWQDHPEPRRQILCSRSFGQPVTRLDDLLQAISRFTSRAAEKLRAQNSLAGTLQVFARTSYFKPGRQHACSAVLPLTPPSDRTDRLIAAALAGLRGGYRPGCDYAKAGVCLMDIQPAHAQFQYDLFAPAESPGAADRTMLALDRINARFGADTLQIASALHDRDAPWLMRQERMSPRATTCWNELIEVRC